MKNSDTSNSHAVSDLIGIEKNCRKLILDNYDSHIQLVSFRGDTENFLCAKFRCAKFTINANKVIVTVYEISMINQSPFCRVYARAKDLVLSWSRHYNIGMTTVFFSLISICAFCRYFFSTEDISGAFCIAKLSFTDFLSTKITVSFVFLRYLWTNLSYFF